jgi:hypothetical protein
MQHGARAPSQWTIYLDHGVYFGRWWRKTRKELAKDSHPSGSRQIANRTALRGPFGAFMLRASDACFGHPWSSTSVSIARLFSANCQTQRGEPLGALGYGHPTQSAPSQEEASAAA